MFQKLSNSWELVKASAAVLSKDKELMIFPILSAVGTLIVSLTFFIPMFFANLFDTIFNSQGGILLYLVLFLFYIVQYTVIFYANTALVGAALIRLRGGDPTVGDGFRIANSHLGSILGYAVIAATVGMVLRMISERSRGLGRIVVGLIGFAWNIATFLVVPILASEDIGPVDAIKRSTTLLKKTWGEQIAGNFGVGAVFGLAGFLIFVLGAGGIALAIYLNSLILGLFVGVMLVLAFLLLGLLNATLSGIYTAAVYRYAVDGEVSLFNTRMVQGAFVEK